jgi:hypothetical protein
VEQLIKLYFQMYEHTLWECTYNCKCPQSCCSPEYCEMAQTWAREEHGIELKVTDHPSLPLMGPLGCTAAPYLRPACTLHTCQVNGLGFKPGDDAWTREYFRLRDNIESIEVARIQARRPVDPQEPDRQPAPPDDQDQVLPARLGSVHGLGSPYPLPHESGHG